MKGIGIIMLAVLLTAGLTAGCAPDNGDDPVPVTGVTLNETTLTLVLGGDNDTEQLTATVSPPEASNKAVTWASDKPAVATVSTSGRVIARSAGTAIITVTTKDGGKTASCEVTVTSTAKPTKAEIEADIDAHWQEYGYSEKPTKYIALSFDDGPKADVTQSLLNALAEKNVKATFFLIGQNIRSQKTLATAIFNAGHELANHSNAYSDLGSNATAANGTVAAITTSLTTTSDLIAEITGAVPDLFRAPSVNYGANLTQVCRELGLAIIGVSLWSNDWQNISTEQTITNVLASPKDGDIINCHELANTVAAVPAIVDGLREKGFWIMTVGELAAVKEKTLVAGTQYDSIK